MENSLEEYYDYILKRWSYGFPKTEMTKKEIENLRNAKINNQYIISKNDRYPGIATKRIYYKIDSVKLILNNGKLLYLAGSGQRSILKTSNIINWKKIKKHITEDYTYAVEYVEDLSYLNPIEKKNMSGKITKENYSKLSESAKLYYQLFGNLNLDNN